MPDYEYEYEYEHDLDRTQREFEAAVSELQPEHFAIPGEAEYFGEAETPHETGAYRNGFQHPSQEAEELELELAAELLEVTSEEELDRFLGDVFKKVGGFVSGAVKSPVFKALGGVLKPIAKAALPIAGGALGTMVGGPVGGAIGSKLASAAGGLFGLELEGLSPEDREFEMAKGFVRLASGAAEEVKNMRYHPGQHPEHAAKAAVMRAGERHLGVRPEAITENIDIVVDDARPRPHEPRPHEPRPHEPRPHEPRPHEPRAHVREPYAPPAHAIEPHAPRPHAREPYAPPAHALEPHAPRPHAREPYAPPAHALEPHAPRPQAPQPQVPGRHAPRPEAPPSGPHATADGSHAPPDGLQHPAAVTGAWPVSHGDVPGEPIPAGARHRGTWFRRGHRIILVGV
jgi:hypothetical protein